jgi:hypothetical protein
MTLGLPGCGGPEMIILRVELDQVLLASHRGRPVSPHSLTVIK